MLHSVKKYCEYIKRQWVVSTPPEQKIVFEYIGILSLMCKSFTFTFMHLTDAFIQSDLQLHPGYTFSLVHVFPGNRTHNLLHCWRNALPLSHTRTRLILIGWKSDCIGVWPFPRTQGVEYTFLLKLDYKRGGFVKYQGESHHSLRSIDPAPNPTLRID